MAQVTYTINVHSNTNTDLSNGRAQSGTLSRNGSVPSGAKIISAELYISALKCYTGENARLQIGNYGETASFSKNTNTHSETVSFFVDGLNLLTAEWEAITLTVLSDNNGNALNIRDGATITLTVAYQVAFEASTANFSTASIEAGKSFTLTVNNGYYSELRHDILIYFGSKELAFSMDVGVSSVNINIPMEWLEEITAATSKNGTLRISTYTTTGGYVGYNMYYFTVTVPDAIVPVIESQVAVKVDNTASADWGVYVQGKSGIQLTANNCTGAYGSTVRTYRFSGGGVEKTTTNSTCLFDTIMQSGDLIFTVEITDSRGRTATKNITVMVLPYEIPKVDSVSAYRTAGDGVVSSNGTYVTIKLNYTYSNCNYYNNVAIYIYYRLLGTEQWQQGTGGWGHGEEAHVWRSGDVRTFGGAFTVNQNWQVMISLQDSFTTITRILDVTVGDCTLFFKNGGQAIGIGMENSADAMNVIEVNPDWEIVRGGTRLFELIASIGNYFPSSHVIYNEIEPPVIEGAIWLKPVL